MGIFVKTIHAISCRVFTREDRREVAIYIFLMRFFKRIIGAEGLYRRQVPLTSQIGLFMVAIFCRPLPRDQEFQVVSARITSSIMFQIPSIIFQAFKPGVVRRVTNQLSPTSAASAFTVHRSWRHYYVSFLAYLVFDHCFSVLMMESGTR